LDVSLRLRFLRPGDSFKFICTPEQMEKMNKVITHNGGVMETEKREEDSVFAVVRKAPTAEA